MKAIPRADGRSLPSRGFGSRRTFIPSSTCFWASSSLSVELLDCPIKRSRFALRYVEILIRQTAPAVIERNNWLLPLALNLIAFIANS